LRKLILEHSTTIPLSAHDERRIEPGYDPERVSVRYGTILHGRRLLGIDCQTRRSLWDLRLTDPLGSRKGVTFASVNTVLV